MKAPDCYFRHYGDGNTKVKFKKTLSFKKRKIFLNEGQKIDWFSEKEARETVLAYGFNEIVDDFFKKSPHQNLP